MLLCDGSYDENFPRDPKTPRTPEPPVTIPTPPIPPKPVDPEVEPKCVMGPD
jgi:hypothetical protein